MRDCSTEALLFDLGGVVFGVDFERAFAHWAQHADTTARTISSRYRPDTWYERHERGEITAAEYFDALRDSLGISLSDEEFARGWNAIFEAEPPGAFALLEALARRMPIYAFSNSNALHQRFWEKKYARTLGLFRQVFVSCDLGMRKPDANAFRHVAARIGAPPERVLFFDDTLENVVGAREVGMPAVHVSRFADVESAAARFLDADRR